MLLINKISKKVFKVFIKKVFKVFIKKAPIDSVFVKNTECMANIKDWKQILSTTALVRKSDSDTNITETENKTPTISGENNLHMLYFHKERFDLLGILQNPSSLLRQCCVQC